MESIRKIIKTMIGGILLFYAFESIGQNIYDFPTIYYNTDTNRCVMNRDENSLVKDSNGLYVKFFASVEIPILEVNDSRLVKMIDSCVDAAKGYLQYPDSSGYFVELILYERHDDSTALEFSIRPFSNYYMGYEILSDWDEAYYEWYGHGFKDLQGGFFLNNILCIVASAHWVDYERASFLFSPTQETIKLMMYRPTVTLIDPDQVRIVVNGKYYFDECKSIHKSSDIRKSVKIDFAK